MHPVDPARLQLLRASDGSIEPSMRFTLPHAVRWLLRDLPIGATAYLDCVGLEILVRIGGGLAAIPLSCVIDDLIASQLRLLGAIRPCPRSCPIGTPLSHKSRNLMYYFS